MVGMSFRFLQGSDARCAPYRSVRYREGFAKIPIYVTNLINLTKLITSHPNSIYINKLYNLYNLTIPTGLVMRYREPFPIYVHVSGNRRAGCPHPAGFILRTNGYGVSTRVFAYLFSIPYADSMPGTLPDGLRNIAAG